uniref:Amidohydro-rel domain-containing protein n=1 Tax=Syphacia muris TaxID=451379 RepID=A0A0N5AIQ1_9BILA
MCFLEVYLATYSGASGVSGIPMKLEYQVLNARNRIIKAALVWNGKEFDGPLEIHVDLHGIITKVGKSIAKTDDVIVDLGNKAAVTQRFLALLPGFINAHSRAFHKQMRGRSQIGAPEGKWSHDMYSMIMISYISIQPYLLETFKEMISAGITTVGEFYYIHHQGTDRFKLDKVVMDAAKDAGVRIVLIDTLYYRGGFDNQLLTNAQKKFLCHFEDFVKMSIFLTTAVIIHKKLLLQEIKDCQDINKCRPSDLLLNYMVPTNANIIAVHCSFTTSNNMKAFVRSSVSVCLTEVNYLGYLGNGIPNIADDSKICIGTDCNNRISILEEFTISM